MAKEAIVRRQFTTLSDETPFEEEDITDQLPINPDGLRYFHPGGPGTSPFVVKDGERLVSRVYGSTHDIVIVYSEVFVG